VNIFMTIYEVQTVVLMKTDIFRDVTSYQLVNV
jgi:hypothetical protein